MNETTHPIRRTGEIGQSIWLDDIHRGLLASGRLQGLIEKDGLAGVTSNPAILEQAITHHDDYNEEITHLRRAGWDPRRLYEHIAVEDLRRAADLLRPLYRRSEGRDGLVSLEVSPEIANDTLETIREAQRLWQAFDRPNAMIKVPATRAGLPAIQQLIAGGINVNATLLFSPMRYRDVHEAYVSGLEVRLGQGLPVERIESVASFFVSRIDTRLDPLLGAKGAPELLGETAVALARHCYADWHALLAGGRWQVLAEAGARPQRLLWASMSAKNPAYSDVKYVESLIGPQTVATLPLQTLEAFLEQGRVEDRLSGSAEAAQATLERIAGLGIDIEVQAEALEREGVQKFIDAYRRLLATLESR